MEGDLLHPDDLRRVADLCVDTLRPHAALDWSVPAADLEWSCRYTLHHMGGTQFSYLTHLGARFQHPTPFRLGTIVERADWSEAQPDTLLSAARTLAYVLAEIAAVTPPTVRAYHIMGMADRSGFLAMGCDELLIHTDDITRTFQSPFRPPEEMVLRVLARLFPWAPRDSNPWETLRWANGRTALPPHYERLGPDWGWHCAPLEEWNGAPPAYIPHH